MADVEVEVYDGDGNRRAYRDVPTSDVGAHVLSVASAECATVAVDARDARLLVGTSHGRAIVALFGLAGTYQWRAPEGADGRVELMVGGLPTNVDAAFVLLADAAAAIAQRWAEGDLDPPGHAWEPQ